MLQQRIAAHEAFVAGHLTAQDRRQLRDLLHNPVDDAPHQSTNDTPPAR
jgi:hypothetical protein